MSGVNSLDTVHKIIKDEEGNVRPVSVTKPEREYINARMQGKEEVQAMKEAGLDQVQLWRSKERGDLQLYVRDKLIEAGLDENIVIETLKNGLKAEKYVPFVEESVTKDGGGKGATNLRSKELSTIAVADHQTRHTYLRTLLELQGLVSGAEIKPTTVNNTVNFINAKDIQGKSEGELLAMQVARARAIQEGKVFVVGEPDTEDAEFEYDVPGTSYDVPGTSVEER